MPGVKRQPETRRRASPLPRAERLGRLRPITTSSSECRVGPPQPWPAWRPKAASRPRGGQGTPDAGSRALRPGGPSRGRRTRPIWAWPVRRREPGHGCPRGDMTSCRVARAPPASAGDTLNGHGPPGPTRTWPPGANRGSAPLEPPPSSENFGFEKNPFFGSF